MIIEKPYAVNDTVTLKLIGGDEVVARLAEETSTNFLLTKPMVVMMAQQGFGFMPYVLTASPDIKINVPKQHVITIVKTHKPVADAYIQQTTGLTI